MNEKYLQKDKTLSSEQCNRLTSILCEFELQINDVAEHHESAGNREHEAFAITDQIEMRI